MNKKKLTLDRIGLIFAIFGITICQIITTFWNKLPCVKINKVENKVEKIKVLQNYDYIEQILGKPMIKDEFKLPVRDKEEYIIGSKAIFNSKLYTIIAYFDDIETLQGYFLISHKSSFKPKMFKDNKIFNKKISDFEVSGYLALMSSSYSSRQDGSSHYMKYFTHHLSTNGCLIGVGISSLGYYKNKDTFFCLAGKEDYFTYGTPVDYDIYRDKLDSISKNRINTFAIFIYDYTCIDIIELLRKETKNKLGMSELEYSILVD